MSVISYDRVSMNTGILLDLPHFEGGGEKVHDLSWNRHSMDGIHAPVWSTLLGGANVLDYDGSNDYLTISAALSTELDITTINFTFLAWVLSSSSASDMIFMKGLANTDGYEFYLTQALPGVGDTVSVRLNQGPAGTSIAALDAVIRHEWQLVGATRNGAYGQIYVNGLPVTTVGSGSLANPTSSAARVFTVGKGAGGNYFTGSLGKIRIWARELSPVEMFDIFKSERDLYGA